MHRCTPNRPRLRAWCAKAACTAPRQRAHCAVSWRAVASYRRPSPAVSWPGPAVSLAWPLPRSHCALCHALGRCVTHSRAVLQRVAVACRCRVSLSRVVVACRMSLSYRSVSLPYRSVSLPYRNPSYVVSRHSQRPYFSAPCHDTINCIVTRLQPGCLLVTIQSTVS